MPISPRLIAKRALIALASVAVLLYLGDYLYFRLRMLHPRQSDPLESFTRPRVLAIPEKGGKTSYEIDQQDPQQTITCVHSLFPHGGYSPCWYVKPRIDQPIQM